MPDTFIKIATVTVGSGGAATMQFSSIPSTYTDLCVKVSARTDYASTNDNIKLSFNGSTSSFSARLLYGSGSAAGSSTISNNTDMVIVDGANATSSTFGNGELYIPNYAGGTNKSYSADSVAETNATATFMYLTAGLWSNTSAINSITMTPQGGSNFVQYTTATLYGISNS